MELVPVIVDAIDARIVGAHQIAGELQIVGRVGEHQIDAGVGNFAQFFQAVADANGTRRRNAATWPVLTLMMTQLAT